MKIESIWLTALMLQTKERIFNEKTVTNKELNTMINILKNKYKIEVIKDEEKFYNYFINVNKDSVSFNEENKISSDEMDRIYNEYYKGESKKELKNSIKKARSIINKELINISTSANVKFTNLEKIIKKVVDDETFYKAVASFLTPSEYNYIKNGICDKTCLNCTNSSCEPVISSKECCLFWDNKEEIGKIKVLGKF